MLFKTILKSLYKDKIISLFILIQFTLTVFMSFIALENYEIINQEKKTVSKFFDIKKTIVIYQNDDHSGEAKFHKDYILTLEKLKMNKDIECIGQYSIADGDNVENTLNNAKKYIFLNDDMLKIIKLEDNCGKRITGEMLKKDLQTNEYSAIVGTGLKAKDKSFNIIFNGETISYKGVSTIKENSFFPADQYIGAAPINLKDSALCIEVNEQTRAISSFRSFIKFSTNDVTELKDYIYNSFKEKGIEVRVLTVEEDLGEYISQNQEFFVAALKITAGLSIFSLLGTVITLILSINRKKREFGIRMAVGSSKLYLIELVYGQLVVIITAAYLIAFLWEQSRSDVELIRTLGVSFSELFNLAFSVKYLLLVFVILLIFSSMVIKMILRLEPGQLVRGKN